MFRIGLENEKRDPGKGEKNLSANGGDKKSVAAKSDSQKSDKAIFEPIHTDEELSKLAGVSRRPSESNILWNLRILRTFQTCVLVAFVFAV